MQIHFLERKNFAKKNRKIEFCTGYIRGNSFVQHADLLF